jgi:hypothetical protein
MAKLLNYSLIYLTTYKDIFNIIISDEDIKKKCVKSSVDEEIKLMNKDETELVEFKDVNLGRFDFIVMGDDKIKTFMQDTMKKYGLNEIGYSGIDKEHIKNHILDSEELNLMFYMFSKKIKKDQFLFNEKHLLELDSLLTDYSYVNDCKYKIIAKHDYGLM